MSKVFSQRGLSRFQQGKSLVEFALILPIVMLLLITTIDVGRLLFTYAQAVNALREGLRYAEVLGNGDTRNYLDCSGMRDTVSGVYFAEVDRLQDVTITYINARSDNPAQPDTYICFETGSVTSSQINSGDILKITMQARLPLIMLPGETIEMAFSGQRTIIKTVRIGTLIEDTDQDGLYDPWEISYWGDLQQNALNDPDADACNNGCETIRQTDPTISDQVSSPDLVAGMTVPPAPTGFTAAKNCTDTTVHLSWQAPAGSSTPPYHADNRPIPTFARIYEAGVIDPIMEINPLPPGSCINCVRFNPIGTANKQYYIVFYRAYAIEGRRYTVQSVNSPISTATCDSPEPPAFFTAQADCRDGTVHFSWTPPQPAPDSYEIRRLDGSPDGVLLTSLYSSQTRVCWDCDTIRDQETRTYTIVARLGDRRAVPAAPQTVSCGILTTTTDDPPDDPDPPSVEDADPPINPPLPTPTGSNTGICGADGPQGGNYQIDGRIFRDHNADGQFNQADEAGMGDMGVRVIWAGVDNNFDTVCDNGSPIDQYTNASGRFALQGLKPGLYRLELIDLAPDQRVTTGNYPYPTITLTTDYTLNFGISD